MGVINDIIHLTQIEFIIKYWYVSMLFFATPIVYVLVLKLIDFIKQRYSSGA